MGARKPHDRSHHRREASSRNTEYGSCARQTPILVLPPWPMKCTVHQAGDRANARHADCDQLSGLSTRMPIMLRSQWPWRPSESRGGIPGGRRHDLVFVDHHRNPYPVAQCAASRFDQPVALAVGPGRDPRIDIVWLAPSPGGAAQSVTESESSIQAQRRSRANWRNQVLSPSRSSRAQINGSAAIHNSANGPVCDPVTIARCLAPGVAVGTRQMVRYRFSPPGMAATRIIQKPAVAYVLIDLPWSRAARPRGYRH